MNLNHFFNIHKSNNGKYIYIDTYEYINYEDKEEKEHKLKLQEFNKIEPHKPNNFIMVSKLTKINGQYLTNGLKIL